MNLKVPLCIHSSVLTLFLKMSKGHTHTHTHTLPLSSKSLYRRGRLLLLMFLMMSGFVFEGYGQITCNSIKLKTGAPTFPTAEECFVSRIPVWFEYEGNDMPEPTTFTVCDNFQLQGNLTDAKIESVVLNTTINDIEVVSFMDGETFQVHAFEGSFTPMTFPFENANNPNPLFYIDVLVGSSENFTLDMDMFEFSINTDCGGVGCTPSNFTSFTAPAVSVCDVNNAYYLDFFVDTDDAEYDPITNEATVWVKVRTGTASPQIAINRLGVELTVEDVSGNLEIIRAPNYNISQSDVLGEGDVTQEGNTFSMDIGLFGTNPNVYLNFTNGECKIFPIILKAPTEPLTGGVANFNFDYTRVSFAYAEDGECCSPPVVNSTLNIDEYPTTCNGNAVDFNLNVGSPSDSGCSGTVSIPVFFSPPSGATTMDVDFSDINLEIDLIVEGDMAIDEVATLNSLNTSISTGTLTVNGSTVNLQYTYQSGLYLTLNTGDDLFTIELHNPNMGVGALTDIHVKHSEYIWIEAGNSTDVCVAPLIEESPDIEEVSSCLGQYGSILSVNGYSLEGLDVCMHTLNFNRASICNLCNNTPPASNILSEQSDSDGNFVINYCDESPASLAVCSYPNDDWAFGISTLDFIVILKHILGITPFTDGWQWVAADANNSRTVTTADVIILRKTLLGIYTEFPNQDNWLYVENDFNLDGLIEIPSNWADVNYYYPDLTKSNCDVGFTAVKVGDVNNSDQPQLKGNEENDKMYVNVTDMGILPNGKYGITFEPQVFQSIVGFELALKPDPLKLSYYTWQTRNLSDIDTDVFYHKDGTIRVAWYSKTGYGKYLNAGDGMFSIELNPEIIGLYGVDDIELDNTIIPAHAYRSDGKVYDIELVSNNGNLKNLHNNKPSSGKNNIWVYTSGEEIKLKVQADVSQEAEIRIFDVQGKQLVTTKQVLHSGENLLSIDYQSYWPTGMYFIQLKMKNEILSAKWIKQ